MRSRSTPRGFTLIELLVGIAIIAEGSDNMGAPDVLQGGAGIGGIVPPCLRTSVRLVSSLHASTSP